MTWDKAIATLSTFKNAKQYAKASETVDRLAEPKHLPQLLTLLIDGPDFAVREAVAVPVARLQGVAALPTLLRAFHLNEVEGHDNDSLTVTITDLVESNRASAAAILAGLFASTDEADRAGAAWLWGYLAPDVDKAPLLEAARDASPAVRAAALGSLAGEGRDDVLAAFIAGLADPEPTVRVAALSSLGFHGDRRALPAIVALTNDADERVRQFVAVAQERLGERQAI